MKKTKVIEIRNLSKYIEVINKMDYVSYYRGEGTVYSSRMSSALRPYEFRWNSAAPFPFMKMIDEFYKEIAYKLNEDQGDFIAFAQHHGIPTNLLDITTSPLVALYFACQNKTSEEGVIYAVQNAYIDVTTFIHMYPNKNLIEEIFSNTTKELKLLISIFEKYKADYPKVFSSLLRNLIDSYVHYYKISLSEADEKFYKKLKRKRFDVWECIYYLREASDDLKNFELDECDEEVYLYLALQYRYLKKARIYQEPIHTITFLPNMIYRPIIRFERGRNQQGLFLYQGYMTYIEPVYNFRVLATQHLQFQNIEIHIKNKQNILKELDKVGINRKTLFCDYDSIAGYIKEKYSELKEENKLN